MERSDELRRTYLSWLERVAAGNIGSCDEFAYMGEGASLIGTDPGEWWSDGTTREAWEGVVRGHRQSGTRILAGDPQAFCEGALGWVVDHVTVRSAEGDNVRARITMIFWRDSGTWKIVHLHNSIGIPNDEVQVFREFDEATNAQ